MLEGNARTGSFDDHLALLGRTLAGLRLLVLCGVSGSGKSTALRYLLAHHPDFAGRPASAFAGPALDWRRARFETEVVMVDEVRRPQELARLRRLLARGHTLLVASHLPAPLHRLAGAGLPRLVLRTDADPGKLGRHLRQRGCRVSPGVLAEFCARYGASYTDADIVLERSPGSADFDQAWRRFRRFARLEVQSCGR